MGTYIPVPGALDGALLRKREPLPLPGQLRRMLFFQASPARGQRGRMPHRLALRRRGRLAGQQPALRLQLQPQVLRVPLGRFNRFNIPYV